MAPITTTTTRLFGILDCAIDPALHEHVARLEPGSATCLFLGDLDPELKAVSPHVVELEPGDPLTRAWRSGGWGQAWGLWIESRESLHTVWRRLRHFTQAKLPDGEGPVLFRFWDPRVFRVYLPLVEPGEIAPWFTDIDAYVAETEDGQGTVRYSLAGGGLRVVEG